MNEKYTPGPWHVVGDRAMCSSYDGPWNPIQTERGAMYLISPAVMKDEHFANARLAAAAPSLLAWLKAARLAIVNGEYRDKQGIIPLPDLVRGIEKAIDDAEGR